MRAAARHRRAVSPGPPHEPLWAIAIGAALAASRIGKPGPTAARAEDGRGRLADRPSQMPARGWKDILLRVYRGISDDRILANAAGVTFYGLLAIFPGIAAIVSIYGLFADPAAIAKHLDSMASVLPGGAIDVVRDQLTRLTSQGGTALGVSFAIGLVVSLWSANAGTKALFDALNVVYEEKEARSFIRLNAVSLAFTLGTLTFLLLAIGCVIGGPVVLQYFPSRLGWIVEFAVWPVLLVIAALALSLVYRWGPSRREPRWRWVTWGGGFAAIAWLAGSALFSWYAANFGSFNKTYGSLGAIIGFMTWIWLSAIVVLVGGKLNAEIEHQTVRTSTEGPPTPLGARGADMADTIGAPQD